MPSDTAGAVQGTVVRPPHVLPLDGPVIFLAGPIQGARDWQDAAIRLIQQSAPRIHVASPRRTSYDEASFDFNEQVDWETRHLRRAGRHGVILFWLAKEAVHHPERSYAQTTRFELAEWKVRHERDACKVVVGIEDGFTGARYIRRRLQQDCSGIPICATLEEACAKAVELASGKAVELTAR
jgi:hypothetical protein